MEKYIDTDHLKVEIEKHVKEVKDAVERFTPNMGFFDAKLSGIYDVVAIIDSLQQEPPESLNGKFVFPKFLYARTVDNKTIDVSYAPQSMDAVEYIKNDPAEQPKVELEKEIKTYFKGWYTDETDQGYILHTPDDHAGLMSVKQVARHFYELGKNSK